MKFAKAKEGPRIFNYWNWFPLGRFLALHTCSRCWCPFEIFIATDDTPFSRMPDSVHIYPWKTAVTLTSNSSRFCPYVVINTSALTTPSTRIHNSEQASQELSFKSHNCRRSKHTRERNGGISFESLCF